MISTYFRLLEATAAPAEVSAGATWGSFAISCILMIAVFYFVGVQPQKKKEKADRQLRASLQPGDTIVTIGGFTGRILTIKDDEVTFETGAAKTRLTVKKWAIQTREGPEVQAPAEEPAETAQEENK